MKLISKRVDPFCRVCRSLPQSMREVIDSEHKRGFAPLAICLEYTVFLPLNDPRPLETDELEYHARHCRSLNSACEPGRAVEMVDAFAFVTGSDFLNADPRPFQRVALKMLYNLWDRYPADVEEGELLRVLENKWNLPIDLRRTEPVETLILVCGRRAGKSTLLSFVSAYEMYRLISLGNPQKYYGLRERHPIFLTHVAASGRQARAMFEYTRNSVKSTAFFRAFMDFDKDNSTELRFFSPYDLELNQEIDARNALLPPGAQKENRLHGSLNIKSITTSASTNRGDAIYVLMLSELAHFERAKIDPSNRELEIISENPQTDYAIVKSLLPSVKDFGMDGKVIMESTPREKGGEFYRQYCLGGGMEQHSLERIIPADGYLVLQLATWEANPKISRQSLESDFQKDPVGASMEYGAQFSNPSAAIFSEELIKSIPVLARPLIRRNPNVWRFIICVDPGGKGKVKVSDTYALAWGHVEGGPEEEKCVYWIDGMHGFDAKIRPRGDGSLEQIPVNPNEVVQYIIGLTDDMGGRNYVLEICYDQFDSTAPVAMLQRLGLPAVETTFTNQYKAQMYGDFLQKANLGQVKMYGVDEGGWIERWKQEMLHLQRIVAGNTVFYHHPSTGPVRHDDLADVTANLVHRLCLRASPTQESIRAGRRFGVRPVVRRTVLPVKGPALYRPRWLRYPF